MPTKRDYPCRFPGCPKILRKPGYCEEHDKKVKKQYEQNRETAVQRGYTYRWQKYSKARLKKKPLCVECERNGRVTQATLTDHIIPHKGDMKLFWDPNNHQSLCEQCHNIKTSKEGAFGRVS